MYRVYRFSLVKEKDNTIITTDDLGKALSYAKEFIKQGADGEIWTFIDDEHIKLSFTNRLERKYFNKFTI